MATLDPSQITVFEYNGGDWAIGYVDGKRTYVGHCDDVRERILNDLGVTFEYPNKGFIQTRYGDEDNLATIEGAYARMEEVGS